MLNESIIAVVSTLVGIVMGKGIDFAKARWSAKSADKKTDSDVRTTEVEKAAIMYRDIIVGLRSDLDKVMVHVKELEQERVDCREENATLRAELKATRDALRRTNIRVEELETRIKAGETR